MIALRNKRCSGRWTGLPEHRRSPQTTADHYRSLNPNLSPNPNPNTNLNRSSAVICAVQADRAGQHEATKKVDGKESRRAEKGNGEKEKWTVQTSSTTEGRWMRQYKYKYKSGWRQQSVTYAGLPAASDKG